MSKKRVRYIIIVALLCVFTILGKNINATEYNGHEIRTYYAYYCTWYACGRAWEVLGVDIDKRWGNANKWAESAASEGYTVDYIPAKNTIAVWPANDRYTAGHVAFVENVEGDIMTISEYNYSVSMGYSTTTISTTANRVYGAPPKFIHLVEEKPEIPQPLKIKGDVSKDGFVNAIDAALVLDLYKNGGVTSEDIELADLNLDNVLNSIDAAMILDIYKK